MISKRKHRAPGRRVWFGIILGLLLTELLMWLLSDKLGVHYMLSKIVVTGIVMVFNFVTRKIFLEAH